VNKATDECFLEDRYRKAELRMWDFGKFQAKGYAFPLIGPAPWDCLSKELQNFYLANAEHLIEPKPKGPAPNRTLLKDWYIPDEAYSDTAAYAKWTKQKVEEGITRCGTPPYQCGATYDEAARIVRRTLFAQPVKGLAGLVLGSLQPWAESILLLHGATKTTTAEYSIIEAEDERTEYVPIFDIIAKPVKYDFVFSYSSLEHVSDPWHPNGDLETFARIHDHWLKPGGKLYLALPTGADILNWNSHRVYGKIRWNRIFKLRSWKLVGMFGGDEYKDPTACNGELCGSTEPWIQPGVCDADCLWNFSQKLADRTGADDSFQPIFVLQKEGAEVKFPSPVESPPPMGPSGNVSPGNWYMNLMKKFQELPQ
jgi:SAM-dependent methyltransferase